MRLGTKGAVLQIETSGVNKLFVTREVPTGTQN